ncbi:MAG TPA: cupin domain-containing protein [Roseiarcus sp.]|jgi:mannose-6-phosphate isomerase-like protein (cupin superfamily)
MNPISDQLEPLALNEADAPQDGWDDPVRGRVRWRTLFSKGATPTAEMTCGVAEFRPGDWLALHRHAPPEVYYVVAGAGLMSLDGREIPVRAGSAVFIPSMAEHGIRQTGNEILRLFYVFPVDSFDAVGYLFSKAPHNFSRVLHT